MDTIDARRGTVRSRIEKLRRAMQRRGVAAVVVPSSDPHLSEYLPERWQGREWLSGFTGSVGTLVVTEDFAYGPIAATGRRRKGNWRVPASS